MEIGSSGGFLLAQKEAVVVPSWISIGMLQVNITINTFKEINTIPVYTFSAVFNINSWISNIHLGCSVVVLKLFYKVYWRKISHDIYCDYARFETDSVITIVIQCCVSIESELCHNCRYKKIITFIRIMFIMRTPVVKSWRRSLRNSSICAALTVLIKVIYHLPPMRTLFLFASHWGCWESERAARSDPVEFSRFSYNCS